MAASADTPPSSVDAAATAGGLRGAAGRRPTAALALRESGHGELVVSGLREVRVTSAAEADCTAKAESICDGCEESCVAETCAGVSGAVAFVARRRRQA